MHILGILIAVLSVFAQMKSEQRLFVSDPAGPDLGNIGRYKNWAWAVVRGMMQSGLSNQENMLVQETWYFQHNKLT